MPSETLKSCGNRVLALKATSRTQNNCQLLCAFHTKLLEAELMQKCLDVICNTIGKVRLVNPLLRLTEGVVVLIVQYKVN